MSMIRKLLAMLTMLAMVFTMCALGEETETAADTYTLHYAIGATPLNWNNHAWETSADDTIRAYMTPGLVDTTIAADGVNFEWVYEMATAVEDITETFADREKWGITGDTGLVYRISLNKDAAWQDGTPIDANTYVYSMKTMLDPEMKNYRANSYYTGSDTAIVNAKTYYTGKGIAYDTMCDAGFEVYLDAEKGDDGFYYTTDGYPVCLYTDAATLWTGSDTIADYADAGYAEFQAILDVCTEPNEDGCYPINDEILTAMEAACAAYGGGYDGEWKEMAVYGKPSDGCAWEDVGFYAEDDYTLIWINESPVTMFYFLTNLTGNWLVYEPLYEAGKSQVENLVATDYCTNFETSMSCGPYKIASFEKDKQYTLARNENWYGWTDGKHEGQYQATDIIYDVVADENTQLEMFLKGELTEVELSADQLATYRMSDQLLKTDETYTFRFIFASDLDALTALEDEANDGANKKVLSYDEFREAISYSMDRARFCNEATSAYKPAYYLFNYLYYCDIENDPESQYRRTEPAMQAVLDLYGMEWGEGTDYATVEEAYNAVTGYDLEKARKLFQKVYEQAIADGNYTDGQEIHINCMCSAANALTADDTKQQDLMNEFAAAATEGTGFEGKITFTFQCGAENRYEDVALGRKEMIRGAWGGAAFYPFSTIRCYTSGIYMGGLSKIHESCGWDPTTETIDIVYDFDGDGTAETVTDTFENWSEAINDATRYAKNIELCTIIMAQLETGVLRTYQCIPWSTEVVASMYSRKISYATTDYNIMYGYGGERLLTFNYSDAEWDAYVAEQGGVLNYE